MKVKPGETHPVGHHPKINDLVQVLDQVSHRFFDSPLMIQARTSSHRWLYHALRNTETSCLWLRVSRSQLTNGFGVSIGLAGPGE
jgi:hypothetical protein